MKLNYIGIVAGIIAFISLALPWWTFTISGPTDGTTISMDISVSLYDAKITTEENGDKISIGAPVEEWYGNAALVLIIIAGVAGIVGSLIIGKNGKMILVVAGILALLSIIIFVAGLQGDLSKLSEATGGIVDIGLFSSGTVMGIADYSSYLSFGFWLALIAAILAFVSLLRHPTVEQLPPSPIETA